MEIIDERRKCDCYFHDLNVGDVFEHDGDILMVIDSIETLLGWSYNAVNLVNGVLCNLENQVVNRVNVRLSVSNYV